MGANDLYDYLQKKNARLVKLLDRNESISAFLMGVVRQVQNYANKKGCRVEDIIIDEPRFTGDDKFIAQMKIKGR